MTEHKFKGLPVTLDRSEKCSDVQVVCKDGVAWAHQWLLGRHSPFLRRCFSDQATLLAVQLNHPRIPGLPVTLKEWKNSAEMSQLMLPDYTTKHVNMLLDLLYTGKTSECGDIDRTSGKLVILLLYEDLKIDPEYGGLPSIGDLVVDVVTTPPLRAVHDTSRVLPTNENTDPPAERIPPLVIIPHPSPLKAPAPVSMTAPCVKTTVKEEPDTPRSSPIPDLVDLVTSTTIEDAEVTHDSHNCSTQSEQNQNPVIENTEVETEMDNMKEVPESVNVDMNNVDSFPINESGYQKISSPLKSPLYDREFINSRDEDFCKLDEEEQDEEFEVIAPALSLDPNINEIEQEIHGVGCSVKLERINVKFNSHSSKRIDLQKRTSCEPMVDKSLETDWRTDDKLDDITSILGDGPVELSSHSDEKLSDVDSLLDGKLSDINSPLDEVCEEIEGKFDKKRRSKGYEEDEDYILPASRTKKLKVGSLLSKSHRIESESESGDIGQTKVAKCNSKDKSIKTGHSCSISHPSIPSDDPETSGDVRQSGKSGDERKKSPNLERKKRKSSSPPSRPSPAAKRRCKTPDTHLLKFFCPIISCNFSLDMVNLRRHQKHHPKIYHVLKHLISFHLRKSPCQVYSDCLKIQNKCSECSYQTDSTTSLLTHMAVEHCDLRRRIRDQLAPNSLEQSPVERELYCCVDTYLGMHWECWGREKVGKKTEKKKSDLEESENGSDIFEFLSAKQVSAKKKDTTSTVSREKSVNETTIIRKERVRRAIREKSTSVEKSAGATSNLNAVKRVTSKGKTELDKIEVFKTFICKWCSYEYTSDIDLKRHLLEQHVDKYKMIPLLEAGEKFYECDIDMCSHKAKAKITHMKHLWKIHKQCPMDLLQCQPAWNEKLITHTDFCIERDDLDYRNDGWALCPTSGSIPKTFMTASSFVSTNKGVPDRPTSLDLPSVTILEQVFTSSALKTSGRAPQTEEKGRSGAEGSRRLGSKERRTSGAEERRSGVEYEQESPEVIEEYVSLSIPIPQRKLKRKNSHKLPDNVCKICDQVFTKGPLVSAHIFYQHLQTKDNVWEDLIKDADDGGDQLQPCMICDDLPTNVLQAKLHHYNHHKRVLKKEMEKKGENWAQLLEYIRYDVQEDLEKDVSSKITDEFYPEVNNTNNTQEADNNHAESREQTVVHNIDSDSSEDNHAEKTMSVKINLEVKVDSSNKIYTHQIVALPSTLETKMSNAGGEEPDEMFEMDCNDADLGFPKEICESNAFSSEDGTPSTEDESVTDLPASVSITAKSTSPNNEYNLISSDSRINELIIYENISDTEESNVLASKSLNQNLFREDPLPLWEKNIGIVDEDSGEMKEAKIELDIIGEDSGERKEVTNKLDSGEKQEDIIREDSGKIEEMNILVDSSESLGLTKNNHSTNPGSYEEMEVYHAYSKKEAGYFCTHRVGGCQETFVDKKELHIHARICTARPQTSYNCDVEDCTKRYYYMEDYRKHFLKHHQGEGFQCLTCGAVFSTAGDILQHHNAEHK